MMQREDVKGVIAFLPTVFTASGEIDEDANRANVRVLVEEGIPIIQAAGTLQLGARIFFLGIDEQDLVLEGMMRNFKRSHECIAGER